MTNKTERIAIRLTPEEKELIENAAALDGVSVAAYVRRITIKQARWDNIPKGGYVTTYNTSREIGPEQIPPNLIKEIQRWERENPDPDWKTRPTTESMERAIAEELNSPEPDGGDF